jgi:hypothetical protein
MAAAVVMLLARMTIGKQLQSASNHFQLASYRNLYHIG